MRIGYLGAGAWGFCLANLLAEKGYEVKLWTGNLTLAQVLKQGHAHPKLLDHRAEEGLVLTTDLREATSDVDLIIESVTSKGLRPVLEKLKLLGVTDIPIVLTSKGIEQGTGLLLSEVAYEVLGSEARIGALSGPSLAGEVMKKLPTSVVASSYDYDLTMQICEAFTTSYFRVYPNDDMRGVSFGGAMKNIIAIACAISDGLGYGENTKAALMTRGLHEIRKLGESIGCSVDTLCGLSGLGDLCATCLSTQSRNYIFGSLLAQGHSPEEARLEIGMVVEGAYTCVAALELSRAKGVEMPITEAVHAIIYEGVSPQEAVDTLLNRAVKKEHL